jgi:predicted Zn-dependent protease
MAMTDWKSRARAATLHLGISMLVAASAAWLVFAVWYPYPYREISGGRELFTLVVSIDVILGPLMTLIIFNRAKPRAELVRDLAVVAMIQLAGLGYGLWSVYLARPVHLVFELDRFRAVHAVDVPEELLQRAPPAVADLPRSGPTLVAVRPFVDEQERVAATIAAVQGLHIGARPEFWQPYDRATAQVLAKARPAASCRSGFPRRPVKSRRLSPLPACRRTRWCTCRWLPAARSGPCCSTPDRRGSWATSRWIRFDQEYERNMLKPSVIRSLIASVLIAAQVAPLAVAQNQLPAMGDGADMTAGAERRIGERIVRELYRDPDYIDDPILGEYVQRIWQALLAGARARGELPPELDERFAWEILLGRDGSVNAFALPGGYLGLHLGLIGVVNSRDELASVLAHELTHVTQRHISRLMTQQNRQAPWMVGALILAALAASKSPEMANAVLTGGQALAAQNQLNFSRDMEREADRIGFGVMTQAGFEPSGFVTMFEKLQQASRLNDNGSFPYLRSHPLTTERIADMQSRVPMTGSPMGPQEPTMEHAMVAARARVLSYPGVDLLRAWSTEPELAGFASLSAPRRAAVLYTAALAAERLREYGRAIALVRRLLALTTGNAQASRQARLLAVDIALAANNLPLASSLMETLGSGPSLARPELLQLAQLRTREGRPELAIDSLQTWVATHPLDAAAWQALSAAYRDQNQVLRAVRAEGEVQMAHLDYAGAVDRFKAARALSVKGSLLPADHIEASIIDTRLRLAESRLREQALER